MSCLNHRKGIPQIIPTTHFPFLAGMLEWYSNTTITTSTQQKDHVEPV